MHAAFIFYALYSVVGKLGAREKFFSLRFLILYGAVFILLFVYAILWQQVLKNISLTVATANKTITIVWGIVFGFFFFDEKITPKMILGAIVILIGILILCTGKIDE